MTTAEAAQAWAEANEALAKARDALAMAQDTYKAADAYDKAAWETLQKLSGRIGVVGKLAVPEWASPPAATNGHYEFDDGFKR